MPYPTTKVYSDAERAALAAEHASWAAENRRASAAKLRATAWIAERRAAAAAAARRDAAPVASYASAPLSESHQRMRDSVAAVGRKHDDIIEYITRLETQNARLREKYLRLEKENVRLEKENAQLIELLPGRGGSRKRKSTRSKRN